MGMINETSPVEITQLRDADAGVLVPSSAAANHLGPCYFHKARVVLVHVFVALSAVACIEGFVALRDRRTPQGGEKQLKHD